LLQNSQEVPISFPFHLNSWFLKDYFNDECVAACKNLAMQLGGPILIIGVKDLLLPLGFRIVFRDIFKRGKVIN